MIFFTDFFKAIGNCFKGIQLIFEKGLWPYFFYPLALWLMMWLFSLWLLADVASQISIYLTEQIQFEKIPDTGSWLSFAKPFFTGYFSFIIAIILKFIFWFVSSTFSKYVVLILLSPLFALLSESIEEKINGKKYPFTIGQFIKDIARGIYISIRNLFFEYLIIAMCFIVTLFFPPLAIITIPFLILVSWYFIGFTMFDYNFERHKLSINQSILFAKKYKGYMCGIGLIYSTCMILPFFMGLMLAPILSVAGATISFLNSKKSNSIF